ncbi:neuronal acetylcholine receptor subunit alpha-3 isoform 3-T3 [Morphnus guianensis]|uniref:neuronal acetylcholine receptor subunit alpha-3 n=1 Tax=Astur gentilis TaxID=8957 RepID=UPI002110B363|nr:neuronal acetylcholine receptor subunit alpha-3 [Accipiter gentilis]
MESMHALLLTAAVCFLCQGGGGSEAEHRLYAALFESYNQFVRPVKNVSDPVIIQFEVSMSQLVKVDEVNQIMETNLWLKHIWNDYKLRWNPADYGGAEFIRVPSGQIWKPDIVLYNNAVGDFQVDDKTKALLKYTVLSPEMRDAIESVKYIAENMKMQNEAKEIQDDWKYVAMVIDRIFLWVFILVCILGTAGLFLQPLMAGDEM